MILSTIQAEFNIKGQALVNVAHGLTPNVNTFAMTHAQVAAQNPLNLLGIATVPDLDGNRAQIQFLLKHGADANNKTALVHMHRWKDQRGGICVADLTITSGAAVETKLPSGEGLAGIWNYADTIIETNVVSEIAFTGLSGGDGVYEAKLDLAGGRYLFFDFDCDGGGGDACTDVIALVSWF